MENGELLIEKIMAEHNELGIKGEDLALEYLQKKGYKILASNWNLQ